MLRIQNKKMRTASAGCAIDIAIGSYCQRGNSGLAIGNQIQRAVSKFAEIDPCLRNNDPIMSGVALRKDGQGEHRTKKDAKAGSIHEQPPHAGDR
jgi:hypothetical protein